MRAGAVDRRLELRHRVLTKNAYGEDVVSWPFAYATVWARKLDIRGREFFAAQQVNAELTTRFHIRHRTDVVNTDRAFLDGTEYNISQVSELGRRVGLELFATAVVP